MVTLLKPFILVAGVGNVIEIDKLVDVPTILEVIADVVILLPETVVVPGIDILPAVTIYVVPIGIVYPSVAVIVVAEVPMIVPGTVKAQTNVRVGAVGPGAVNDVEVAGVNLTNVSAGADIVNGTRNLSAQAEALVSAPPVAAVLIIILVAVPATGIQLGGTMPLKVIIVGTVPPKLALYRLEKRVDEIDMVEVNAVTGVFAVVTLIEGELSVNPEGNIIDMPAVPLKVFVMTKELIVVPAVPVDPDVAVTEVVPNAADACPVIVAPAVSCCNRN